MVFITAEIKAGNVVSRHYICKNLLQDNRQTNAPVFTQEPQREVHLLDAGAVPVTRAVPESKSGKCPVTSSTQNRKGSHVLDSLSDTHTYTESRSPPPSLSLPFRPENSFGKLWVWVSHSSRATYLFFICLFDKGFSLGPGTVNSARLADQPLSPKHPSVSTSPDLGLQVHAATSECFPPAPLLKTKLMSSC